MKLFTGKTPMSLRVNVLVAEKNIELQSEWLNVAGGETHTPEFFKRNNLGQVPVLELDDGSHLTESIAICRYLDATSPDPLLSGATPLEVARIDMWTRRMELQVCAPISDFARHSFEFFKDILDQIPAYAESQLKLQSQRWEWFDKELSDGRTYIVEDKFSIADIAGMSALMINDFAEKTVPDNLTHVKRWEAAMRGKKGW